MTPELLTKMSAIRKEQSKIWVNAGKDAAEFTFTIFGGSIVGSAFKWGTGMKLENAVQYFTEMPAAKIVLDTIKSHLLDRIGVAALVQGADHLPTLISGFIDSKANQVMADSIHESLVKDQIDYDLLKKTSTERMQKTIAAYEFALENAKNPIDTVEVKAIYDKAFEKLAR